MKIVKRILKFIVIITGILLISIIIMLLLDIQSTNYLKVKNKSADNNSFLITNTNIIPMNQDTLLVSKMVYIKDGIIQKKIIAKTGKPKQTVVFKRV